MRHSGRPVAPPMPRCRGRFRLVVGAVVWTAAFFHAGPAPAQQTTGTLEVVVSDSVGHFLQAVRVSIRGVGITGHTDSLGVLRLTGVPAGPVPVVVERFGYWPATAVVQVDSGRHHRISFALQAAPIPVEGIRVEVVNRREQLDFLRGFDERRERGIGYFLTRQDIEARGTSDLSNLLHTVPGLRTSPSQFGQSNMRAARTPVTRQCQIRVYVDGMRYRHPNDLPGIPTSDIEAIEVYRGRSELPAAFADLDTSCGAIVIWTRRQPNSF